MHGHPADTALLRHALLWSADTALSCSSLLLAASVSCWDKKPPREDINTEDETYATVRVAKTEWTNQKTCRNMYNCGTSSTPGARHAIQTRLTAGPAIFNSPVFSSSRGPAAAESAVSTSGGMSRQAGGGQLREPPLLPPWQLPRGLGCCSWRHCSQRLLQIRPTPREGHTASCAAPA